jgi:hypothetical protein
MAILLAPLANTVNAPVLMLPVAEYKLIVAVVRESLPGDTKVVPLAIALTSPYDLVAPDPDSIKIELPFLTLMTA